jgi:hypothetical protein
MWVDSRFQPVFEQLRALLQPFESQLTLKVSTDANYYLVAPYSPKWKAEVMFGAVQIKKNYVSYYLMPVYMYPDLLDGVSARLKRRMQGKSCFNFRKVETDLWAELSSLTERGFERFRTENLP